ncbi:MAG: hypothetical protein JWO59_570 [Chloroflexi bacterium]|nr:hypothetical protein [Chloroflexota bacterium]
MEISEHIAALRREGDLLATTAAAAGLNAPIPTCPEWQMRDMLRHLGGVHKWAATIVGQRRTQPPGDKEESEMFTMWPDDATLVDSFREGHAELVRTLEAAEPDLVCWTFLSAPSPLAFWARRQAHETSIHRADAQSAGGAIAIFPQALAADGIDEILSGFASRPRGKLRADPPVSIQIHATDADRDWLVHVAPDRVEVRNEHGAADCSVHGRASDLYLLLWNRQGPDGLEVHGDATLLDLWRRLVQIRWS